MKRASLFAAAVMLAAAGAGGAATVTLEGITEARAAALDPAFAPKEQYLNVVLRLAGSDLTGASAVGPLKLTEATDDTGGDLSKVPLHAPNGQTRTLRDPDIRPADESFVYQFELAPAQRAAKKVTIKGELTVLAGGTAKDVRLTSAMPLGPVNDPDLQAAGLTLARVKTTGLRTLMQFEVVGSTDAIRKAKIIGRDAKAYLAFPTVATVADDKTILSIVPAADVPAEPYTIVLTVRAGLKNVTVPIEIKDAVLP